MSWPFAYTPYLNAVLWLALEYASLGKWNTRRNVLPLSLVSVFFTDLIATDHLHHLLWTRFWFDGFVRIQRGPLNLLMVGYFLLLPALSLLVFLRVALRSSGIYRRQALLLLSGQFAHPGCRDMRLYSALGLLVTYALLTGCTVSTGAPDTRPPIFAVAPEGEGNEMTASAHGDTSILEVHSRSGIGTGTVEFISGTPPKDIVVRLHLKGLEEFRLLYQKMTIIASVSSGANHEEIQRVISPQGSEQPITSASPFWMDISKTNGQSTSPGASDSGYFEITMPKDLVGEGYRSFSFRWIDFFR